MRSERPVTHRSVATFLRGSFLVVSDPGLASTPGGQSNPPIAAGGTQIWVFGLDLGVFGLLRDGKDGDRGRRVTAPGPVGVLGVLGSSVAEPG